VNKDVCTVSQETPILTFVHMFATRFR